MGSPRRSPQSPRPAALLAGVLVLFGAVGAVLELAATYLFHEPLTAGLHVALGTIAFEIASGTLALSLAGRAPAPERKDARRVSVLVAAFNEASGIAETVRSLAAQANVELEIVVADDGSTDGTSDVLRRSFGLAIANGSTPEEEARLAGNVVLRLLTLPHRGKGAALNAAMAVARHPILVTVDADTVVAPGALRALVAAFDDERVVSATGSVLVSSAPGLLTRFQQIEFVRNTLIRVAWARLGALEQLPGAFSGVRAERLRAVGGFPTDSMTEDYEVTYRLYDEAAREGRPLKIVVVPAACAYTEAPTTLRALARQRTRWFSGFLVTLYRFRHLIGRPRAGVFGLVKLPIKVLDAVHPPLALFSLVVLLADAASARIRGPSLALFFLRWAWDSFTLAMAVRFARSAGANVELGRAGSLWPWVYVLLDGVSYFWVRQVAVLRAYGWAIWPRERKASWGEAASNP